MPERALIYLAPSLTRCRYERMPDDELVDRYAHEQDEGAFTELVHRHGPMVLSVCRRVLRNSADADDVFQATFMVLARKAGSIRPAGAVGQWLHGVAFRTAKEAIRRAARRRAKESRVVPREEKPEEALTDVRPILDAELAQLPKQFAQVLILCDMEGRTRLEVAAFLRVPEGTIASRLSRARGMLAERLTRRGIALTAGVVTSAVAEGTEQLAPPELLAKTVKAAFAFGTKKDVELVSPGALELANAVLSAGVRFKFLVVGLIVAAVAVTGWATTTDPSTHQPPPPQQIGAASSAAPKQPPPAPDPVVALREKLIGQWQVNEGTRDDRPFTDWEKGGFRFDFNASGVLQIHRGQLQEQRAFTWTVDANAASPAILLTPTGSSKANMIRVRFEFRENMLALFWIEPKSGRGARGPATTSVACRVTLSKVGSASETRGLVVTPTPQNVVGSRLVGEWEMDGELNGKLGFAREETAVGKPGKITLTFTSIPTVVRDVPDGYRTLFADKRIYLAGRMTVVENGIASVSYRFLMLEHLGNSTLVYFVPRNGDEWSCEEVATVMLAAGANREKDLLFLTGSEKATHVPVGGFRRVVEKQ